MNEEYRCPNCFQGDISSGVCRLCGFDRQEERPNAMRLPEMYPLMDRYLIGRILGSGGFGITYKAFDLASGRLCAVKEFMPIGIVTRNGQEDKLRATSSSFMEDFEHGKKRFMDEALALGKLTDVPEVVQVMDFFMQNNTAYFVMEYIEGANLRQLMRTFGGRIPAEQAMPIFYEAGMALDQVHRRGGIFHRDISPDNIMVTPEGRVRLIDFGSAKNLIGSNSQTLSVILKHGYAPPEQYSSTSRQGSFTDVYAFAATFYFAVSGVMVTNAPDRFGGEEYRPLKELAPAVGARVSDAVDHALLLNSGKRTQYVSEFVSAFPLPTAAAGHDAPYAPTMGRESPYVKLAGQGGHSWELPKNQIVKIGRSEGMSDIIPTKDGKVSKLHCELFFDSMEKCFYVIDHSTNGVYVAGRRLEKGRAYALRNGEQFSLGNHICDLEVGWNHG